MSDASFSLALSISTDLDVISCISRSVNLPGNLPFLSLSKINALSSGWLSVHLRILSYLVCVTSLSRGSSGISSLTEEEEEDEEEEDERPIRDGPRKNMTTLAHDEKLQNRNSLFSCDFVVFFFFGQVNAI